MTTTASIDRRGFLAALASSTALPLAGCADPSAVLLMEQATTENLAELAEPIRSASDEAEVLEDALANASNVTSGTARSPPLMLVDGPIRYDGRYFTVQKEVTIAGRDYEYRVQLDPVGGESAGDDVPYGELPPVDRRVLDRMVTSRDPDDVLEDRSHPYTPEERNASVLVDGGPRTVAVNGSRFRVTTERGPPIERRRYRYELTDVGGTREAFADRLRERYRFPLDGLSEAETAIVEEAIDSDYMEGGVSEAFLGLAERFRSHRAVRQDEWGGDWIAAYDGTVYTTRLEHPPSAVEGLEDT